MMNLKSLILAAAVSCYAVAVPFGNQMVARGAGSCADTSQFAPINEAGNPNAGTPFCETDWTAGYKPITGLTVFWREYQVAGIQATYSDGTQSAVYGSSNTAYHGSISVDYAKGERWSFWRSYFSSSAGFAAFRVGTSTGAVLRAGEPQANINYDGLSPIAQNVGSGILFGIQGSATTNMASLAGLFLGNNITSISLDEFEFPDGPAGAQNINIDSLSQAHYYNGQESGNVTWTFQNQEAIATTHVFTSTVTQTYGMTETISLSLMIPVIGITAGSMTAFNWMTAYTSTNTYMIAQTVTVSWTESGSLAPGQGVDAAALVGHGQGTYPYTCTVSITLKNGFEFTFRENGALTIDDVSNALVTVTADNSS